MRLFGIVLFTLLSCANVFVSVEANGSHYCPHPETNYLHGSWSTSVEYDRCTSGSTISFSCNSGYSLSSGSTNTFTCGGSGSSMAFNYIGGVRPTCWPSTGNHACSELPSFYTDGESCSFNNTQQAGGGYPTWTKMSFTCDATYAPVMINGNSSIVCQPNGEWGGDAPDCVPKDPSTYTPPGICVSNVNITASADSGGCTTFLSSPNPFGSQKSTCCNDRTKSTYGTCATSSNCNGMQFMACNGGNCPSLNSTFQCKAVNPKACTTSGGKCWGYIVCANGVCPVGHFGQIYPGMVCIADGSGSNNVPDSTGCLTGNVKICGSCGNCESPNVIVDSLGHCCPSGNTWDSVHNVCKPGGVKGDPQFTGFLGQDFQVHGTSNTNYNIISSPNFQYNAHFVYLSSGACRSGTQCFSHPGNYFGSVGIRIKDEAGSIQQLLVQSGDVSTGLKVTVNGKVELDPSEHQLAIGKYTLSMPNKFDFILESDEFNLKIQNSDRFLNQDVSIGRGLMAKIAQYKSLARMNPTAATEMESELPHGILGQTWRNRKHNNRWKHIEGQLYDYVLADSIFGSEFKFNRF